MSNTLPAARPSLAPETMPFDAYLRERPNLPGAAALYAYECVALAKRIMIQERVHGTTSDSIVALAALIAARDSATKP